MSRDPKAEQASLERQEELYAKLMQADKKAAKKAMIDGMPPLIRPFFMAEPEKAR